MIRKSGPAPADGGLATWTAAPPLHFAGHTDAGVSWQRGTRWFGARASKTFGEATALSKILQLNASFNLPFTLAGQPFQLFLPVSAPAEQYPADSTGTVCHR
ncbi:ShlB/FhaC/HecB family hemolysin secretion/activation protein [Escherichia coli]